MHQTILCTSCIDSTYCLLSAVHTVVSTRHVCLHNNPIILFFAPMTECFELVAGKLLTCSKSMSCRVPTRV